MRRLLGAVAVVVSMACGPGIPGNDAGHWVATGSLGTARKSFAVVVLGTGQVLVAGGDVLDGGGYAVLASAELYEPTTGTWRPTGAMVHARSEAAAVLLPSGKVLVAGGFEPATAGLASAELYQPDAGAFGTTGSMATGRGGHTATLLPSGKVLVAGGYDSWTTVTATAELYDPATGQFSATGAMHTPRQYHAATLLPSGKVLVSGGCDSTSAAGLCPTATATAELYDPAAGSWASAGTMPAAVWGHSATLLSWGKVLVAGGCGAEPCASTPSNAALYEPPTGWTAVAAPALSRVSHVARLLRSGRVLVAGGTAIWGVTTTATEQYDPDAGTWTPGPPMLTDHGGWSGAVVLPGGDWLVTGGFVWDGNVARRLATAERLPE